MIISIKEFNSDGLVCAETEFGPLFGRWKGNKILAQRYIVELSCDEILTSNSVCLYEYSTYCIQSSPSETTLFGFVDDIEDNLIYLRVGYDLIMLEFLHEVDICQYYKCFVSVVVHEVLIFDIME